MRKILQMACIKGTGLQIYEFNFIDKRWHENCADFVIINDRNLYVSLVELYEILTDDKENSYEEKYKYCVMCHDEIQEIIKKLDRHELKNKEKNVNSILKLTKGFRKFL